jgi:hypothetical protein
VNNVEDQDEGDEVVRRDKGAWISGAGLDAADTEAADLLELQARYQRWSLWKGKATGRFWGASPASLGLPLIDAGTVDELAGKIADIESWQAGG